MKFTIKAGLASVALAAVACFTPVSAADLGGGYQRGGSIKDSPSYSHAPAGPVGPCYFRADTGYSWSRDPDAQWVGNVDPKVAAPSLDNGWFGEAGLGCAMGSRGFRADMMLGMRQTKDFHGDVNVFVPNQPPIDPLLKTEIKSYTMMFNAYHDLGKMGGFVPYVGAGLGWAYHKMGEVTIDNVNTPNRILAEDKLSFAWALMAGVGYQISDRAILDVGYRFIDLGLARGSHGDNTLSWNPRLEIDDMRSHEIKVGLRYHFGTDCCGQSSYTAMK